MAKIVKVHWIIKENKPDLKLNDNLSKWWFKGIYMTNIDMMLLLLQQSLPLINLVYLY